VAVGAAAVPGLRYVPVPIAVGNVAIRAEPRVVINPAVWIWAKDRGGQNACAIRSALLASMGSPPPLYVATSLNRRCHRFGSRCSRNELYCQVSHCSHSAGSSPGATSSMRVDSDPQTAHGGAATIPVTMRPRVEPGPGISLRNAQVALGSSWSR
jgi:hypothetical protein